MLGFTLPLLIIIGLEAAVGCLLLCPKPLNQPAIALARVTATQIGSTVFHTLAGVLLLLMASPVYDGIQLMRAAKEVHRGDAAPATALDHSENEARTLLSFTLTFFCLAMMFFLRKLGLALGQLERMSVSEAALLKQVKGLQTEYTRMVDSSGGAVAGNGGGASSAATAGAAGGGKAGAAAAAGALSQEEVAELRRLVADLEKMNSELNARLEKANKAHQLAESNLSALKTQSRGLENEYDRLLADHDELRRQLQRAGLAPAGATESRMGKKDE